MKIEFIPRTIGGSVISTLHNLYYYTGRWDLSVTHFTGKDRAYWEKLPEKLRNAKNLPGKMEKIIKELESLAEAGEARKERRTRLIKYAGFEKKEVVINEQLLAILASLPQKMLSDIFRKMTDPSLLSEEAQLVDMRLGTGEQLIEPDFLVQGDQQLMMGEIKVNARKGFGAKYDAKQLVNYLSLVQKLKASRQAGLFEKYSHIIILPEDDFEWFVKGSEWIKSFASGTDERMEFNVKNTYALAKGSKKQHYVKDEKQLGQLLSEVPVYCRTYKKLHYTYEDIIRDYPLKEHWQRIGDELGKLCTNSTYGIWQWKTGKVDKSKEHVEITYGDINKSAEKDFTTVARVSPPYEQTCTVEFLLSPENDKNSEMMKAVKKDINFYIVEKNEFDPWRYIRSHCGSTANLYSNVHWIYREAKKAH